ncbi:MAG: calcium-binding protein [bacterium]
MAIFNGTASDDDLVGVIAQNDELYGLAGNDSLRDEGGSDLLDGGDGADDLMSGDGGADTLLGGAGDDLIRIDALGGEAHIIDGGADNDTVIAEAYIVGGASMRDFSNITFSNVETLDMTGNWVGIGANQASAAFTSIVNFDRLTLTSAGVLDLTTMTAATDVGDIDGSSGSDTILATHSTGAWTIDGNAGNDTISTGAGADEVDGGAGNDLLNGGGGNDLLTDQSGADTVNGNAGNDEIRIGDGGITIVNGGNGDDIIKIDGISGEAHRIAGGAGNDMVVAEAFVVGSATMRDFSSVIFSGVETLDMTGNWIGMEAADFTSAFSSVLNFNRLTLTDGGTVDLTTMTDATDGGRIIGSTKGDVLIATHASANWTFEGNEGGDELRTGAGHDTLNGGAGTDQLFGGAGNDNLDGGIGNDQLRAEDGDDLITDRFGEDLFNGGNGNDTIRTGDNGADLVFAGAGDDIIEVDGLLATAHDIRGGAGSDTVKAEGFLTGAAIYRDLSNMTFTDVEILDITGNSIGIDAATLTSAFSSVMNLNRISFTASGTVDFSTLMAASEGGRIDGAVGDDVIRSAHSTAALTITGQDGDDFLTGGLAADSLFGNDGRDVLDGRAGGDSLNGGGSVDWVYYTTSNAGVNIDLELGTASGGHADGDFLSNIERLYGSTHNDSLTGSSSANYLRGNIGDDMLDGGQANDILEGGAGADMLEGGTGKDWAYYINAGAGVSVDLAAGTASGDEATGDTLSNIENVRGSAFADTLIGSDNRNTLRGGAGDDILDGGNNRDIYTGEGGSDIFVFQQGDDFARITDFENDTDSLDLSDYGFASQAAAAAFMTQVGLSTYFTFAGERVIVQNMTVADLTDDVII